MNSESEKLGTKYLHLSLEVNIGKKIFLVIKSMVLLCYKANCSKHKVLEIAFHEADSNLPVAMHPCLENMHHSLKC